MKSEKTQFEKTKKFPWGKTLYAVLAVCAFTVSVMAWKSTGGITVDIPEPESSSTLYNWSNANPSTTLNPAEDVNNPVYNIPDERETSQTETTTEPIKQNEFFSYPLSETVSNGYSDGSLVKSATTDDWRTHNGTDFPAAEGDIVKAINNGVVTAVYDDSLWGTVVEIDHGNKMTARYCGLGKGSTVSVGDKIKANDKVGNLGTIPIESAEKAHLHLEIRVDGVLKNPLEAMGKK